MKHLNVDQKLRKGHKDVQNLGMTATAVLYIELQQLIVERMTEIEDIIEENKLEELRGGEDFEYCNDMVAIGMVRNESVLKVLRTYSESIKLYNQAK